MYLQTGFVTLGALATVSSIALAAFVGTLSAVETKILAFVPTACLGLIAAFNFGGKANSARTAWRLLNAAVLAYENDQSYTIQDLHKQYVAGESLIGDIRFNASASKEHPDRHGR